jgi:hypothetical protein
VYPDDVWDSDNFTFEKLEVGDGAPVNNWLNTGESLDLWFSKSVEPVPAEFVLFRAYPNPFNPTTNIGFTLPEAQEVSLVVFDLAGREVADLVDGWRDAGMHEVTFDGSDLASGIYLYRLQVGQFSYSQKLVHLK